jgi:hypothetical protein
VTREAGLALSGRGGGRGGRHPVQYLQGMASRAAGAYDRVVERRRAVALARHFREAEGLSIAQIADRLGRPPATIKACSTTLRGRRRGRSRSATRGCAGAAALHRASQRQGRRLGLLQGLPPGGPAAVDPRAGAGRDARVARALRAAAILVRLVIDACPLSRQRRPRAAQRRPVAVIERGHERPRKLGCSAREGRRPAAG